MTNSNTKGDRREREFVNYMADIGWTPVRMPASGSATKRDLPDVILGKGGKMIAVEVKSSGGDPIYLDGEEVDALERFGANFGASPRVAVKFDLEDDDPAWGEDRAGFYLLAIQQLYETDGGNYRVKKELAHEVGTREVDL